MVIRYSLWDGCKSFTKQGLVDGGDDVCLAMYVIDVIGDDALRRSGGAEYPPCICDVVQDKLG